MQIIQLTKRSSSHVQKNAHAWTPLTLRHLPQRYIK